MASGFFDIARMTLGWKSSGPYVSPTIPPLQELTPGVGAITPKEDLLQNTLAGLSKMQAWLGVSDSTSAKNKIFIGDLPPPPSGCEVYEPEDLVGLRPFAVLYTEPQAGFRAMRDAIGLSFHFAEGGRLVIMFEQEVDASLRHNLAEVRRRFMNSLGEIAYELLGVAGLADKLAITKLTVFGPYRGDDDDIQGQGDPIIGYFDIEWGNA